MLGFFQLGWKDDAEEDCWAVSIPIAQLGGLSGWGRVGEGGEGTRPGERAVWWIGPGRRAGVVADPVAKSYIPSQAWSPTQVSWRRSETTHWSQQAPTRGKGPNVHLPRGILQWLHWPHRIQQRPFWQCYTAWHQGTIGLDCPKPFVATLLQAVSAALVSMKHR